MYALPYIVFARLHQAAIAARRRDRTWHYLLWSACAGVLAALMLVFGATLLLLFWRVGLWPLAIVVFAINLVGMGLGPLIVGALNDALAPRFGLEAVRYSLMVAAIPHTLAAVFNLLAARTLREDLALAARPAPGVHTP